MAMSSLLFADFPEIFPFESSLNLARESFRVVMTSNFEGVFGARRWTGGIVTNFS